MICARNLFTVFCLIAVSPMFAGEFNEVLSIGANAPVWDNLPGTDGRNHSFSEFENAEAIVVSFTCLSCPTALDYEDRFNTLAKKYGGSNGKVGFIAICVNRVEADRLEKLTERAKKQSLAFPYLYDESQKIARDYGAIFTPEYFVLNKERKITYMGAFDDASEITKVTKNYVEDALLATLKNEASATRETLGRGCRIRYVANRRSN